jgi:hypothetical protein
MCYATELKAKVYFTADDILCMNKRLQVDIKKAGKGFRYTVREISTTSGKCLRVLVSSTAETHRDAELEARGAMAVLTKV